MSIKWIVIAHGAGAKLFKQTSVKTPLKLVKSFENPKGKLHTRDLVSDRPGRSFSSKSGSGVRHALGKPNEAHNQLIAKFATEIATFLDRARLAEDYEKLILVAEPKFLGKLKKALSSATKKTVALSIAKDLAKVPNNKLKDHLEEVSDVF